MFITLFENWPNVMFYLMKHFFGSICSNCGNWTYLKIKMLFIELRENELQMRNKGTDLQLTNIVISKNHTFISSLLFFQQITFFKIETMFQYLYGVHYKI
jgi:hypothetical protein